MQITAQSLSELARQSEEARATAAADDLFANRHFAGATYTEAKDAVNLRLTLPLFRQFCVAWADVSRALLKNAELARRYTTAFTRAHTADESERAMTSEPLLLAALGPSGMTARMYVTTGLAYQLAGLVENRMYPAGLADFGNIGPNVKLLARYRTEVDALRKEPVDLARLVDALLDAPAANK